MTYLVLAYGAAVVLVGGYVVHLARRIAGLKNEVDDIRRERR